MQGVAGLCSVPALHAAEQKAGFYCSFELEVWLKKIDKKFQIGCCSPAVETDAAFILLYS